MDSEQITAGRKFADLRLGDAIPLPEVLAEFDARLTAIEAARPHVQGIDGQKVH